VTSNLIIAAVAGCINVLSTCPLWVVNTRIKLQKKNNIKYHGIFDGLIKISQEEGVGELWNGTMASLILVSNPTIQFFAYDKLKDYIVRVKSSDKLSSFEFFLLGAAAKAIATILTYPLQVAQSRLRAISRKDKDKKKDDKIEEKEEKQERYRNTFDCLIKIFRKDGIMGWFSGLDIKILQTVLTAAFQFLIYEKIHTFMLILLRNSDINKKK